MINGLAELIIFGLIVDFLFRKVKIPGLVGMLAIGIIAGPSVLGLLGADLLIISSDLRMLALIIILMRAGFELKKDTLRRVGFQAAVLSFVPASFECAAITLLGPRFLHLTYLESAMLGAVLGAVSPAVVVPLMMNFIQRRKGTDKGIPTLILAASSVDDVFVIVIYTVLIGFYTGSKFNLVWKLAGIPISIIMGIGIGGLCGLILYQIFERYNPRATKRVLIALSVSVLLVAFESYIERWLPFAALLAVMAMGAVILEKNEYAAHELSHKLTKLWVCAEIILFALVGSQVDIRVAWRAGLAGSAIILLGLVARSVGTYLCLIGSNFTQAERFFIVISYIPKATVQAAIGGTPLIAMQAAGMNTQPGQIILAVAVLSILLTAPLGAWAIAFVGNRVLKEEWGEPGEMKDVSNVTEEEFARLLKADEAMDSDVPIVRRTDKIKHVLNIFAENDTGTCVVVDAHNKLQGIIQLDDLRPILTSHDTWEFLTAGDALQHTSEAIYPETNLQKALEKMGNTGLAQIPVAVQETGHIVGILNREKAKRYIHERWLGQKMEGGEYVVSSSKNR